MSSTNPDTVNTLVSEGIRNLKKIADYYGSFGQSNLIAAATISSAMLLSLALLSVGTHGSVFEHGIFLYKKKEEEVEDLDEAEAEIFTEEAERLDVTLQAEDGIETVMSSSIPLITLAFAIVICAGSYYVAVTTDAHMATGTTMPIPK